MGAVTAISAAFLGLAADWWPLALATVALAGAYLVIRRISPDLERAPDARTPPVMHDYLDGIEILPELQTADPRKKAPVGRAGAGASWTRSVR